jgi:hypothetical protein
LGIRNVRREQGTEKNILTYKNQFKIAIRPEGRWHLGDTDMDGPSLWRSTMGGSCEHGDDPFDTMKDEKFPE